jgi:hypothetical protein
MHMVHRYAVILTYNNLRVLKGALPLLITILSVFTETRAQTALTTSASIDDSLNWVLVTDSAAWKPRDSSGEVVFKNKLWILGGWFNSFEPPPRDIWNSADGIHWNLITNNAPWKHSDFPMTIAFKNKIWVMGGWYNGRLPDHSASNSVWSSRNGKSWKKISDKSEWTPRIGAGLIQFKGKMWILGGTEDYYFGDSSSLKNDVWYSDNGKNWKLATANAGWAPRAFHSAVVFNNKIWIMGGGNYVPEYKAYNDVWVSEDGIHWTEVTDHTPWSPRLWFSGVVYRDRIWVLGGWSNNPSRNWNDIWYSQDGMNWKKLNANKIWAPRHEHSSFVMNNRIWVTAGNTSPLVNDVWYLEIPGASLPAR